MGQRVWTGILAAIVFLSLLFFGGTSYTILLLCLSLIGYFEYVRLVGLSSRNQYASWIGYVGMLYFVIPWKEWEISMISPLYFIWIMMFLFMFVTVISKNKLHIEKVAYLFLGIIYIGVGFQSMLSVRLVSEEGILWSFLIFSSIWMNDIGAYFAGSYLGKRLLWPTISPKKTVEGALGGLLLSIVTSIVFYVIFPDTIDFVSALTVGIIAGIFGQAGDLIQSAYKRKFGVKDSGKILPGHGGILDRCDSWLIVFPVVYFLIF
ncbi:phosphatidate cytidylyltransferase [Longirhabdus pacifica]|uniref:phosphatidate cytidylyltransferase n=1 Tax=Longirhabdus pacifica TaxID=2305227 RepID=UPI00100922D9|nr:phosphatidate cytidylyltransferase [Longirhabdus pacifica]